MIASDPAQDIGASEMDIEEQVRSHTERFGRNNLVVSALTDDDLHDIAWSGSPTHIHHLEAAFKDGELDYLVVRAPDGQPISIGAIDYRAHQGAGTLKQLATMPELQGLGIGSRLVEQLEEKIRLHGLGIAILAVEEDNLRARKLYERLGYVAIGKDKESWESEDENGSQFTHSVDVTLMRKILTQRTPDN